VSVTLVDQDKIFATDFLRFFRVISKKRKKSCFFKSEKNEKYVFSNTAWDYVNGLWAMKSEDVGLIVRAISFQDFQPMCS